MTPEPDPAVLAAAGEAFLAASEDDALSYPDDAIAAAVRAALDVHDRRRPSTLTGEARPHKRYRAHLGTSLNDVTTEACTCPVGVDHY